MMVFIIWVSFLHFSVNLETKSDFSFEIFESQVTIYDHLQIVQIVNEMTSADKSLKLKRQDKWKFVNPSVGCMSDRILTISNVALWSL